LKNITQHTQRKINCPRDDYSLFVHKFIIMIDNHKIKFSAARNVPLYVGYS